MNSNNNNHNQPSKNLQTLDYDSWVNSLGSVQDGIFQNTPMTSHILQHSSFSAIPATANFQQQQAQEMDMFYNSPERFYRDIINESPIITRTPNNVGRTPLRNLSINFSTPNFLKNFDASTSSQIFGSGGIKGFTPLKNQQFNSNDLFQTPYENKENKGRGRNSNNDNNNNNNTLNSSPTTIKMGSSAIKPDAYEQPNTNKILPPPSPTPASKANTSSSSVVIEPQLPTTAVPKMGCFKKKEETKPVKRQPPPMTSNFQIIMTDVNSFANNSSKPRRKKKLGRSNTAVNPASKSITKKSTLKRTMSQPHKAVSPLIHHPQVQQPQDPQVVQLQPSSQHHQVSPHMSQQMHQQIPQLIPQKPQEQQSMQFNHSPHMMEQQQHPPPPPPPHPHYTQPQMQQMQPTHHQAMQMQLQMQQQQQMTYLHPGYHQQQQQEQQQQPSPMASTPLSQGQPQAQSSTQKQVMMDVFEESDKFTPDMLNVETGRFFD